MKRKIVIGAAIAGAGLLALGVAFGPDTWAYFEFGRALDRQQASYEAAGGTWPQLQDSCALCHGAKGQSMNAQYASLAGQPASYIEAQLRAFAEGRRRNPSMEPFAAALTDEQIRMLADYYARQAPAKNETANDTDPALVRRGQAVVAANACVTCHGAALMGSEIGPRLAGQGEVYLLDQLRAFKLGQRQDSTHAMSAMAATLSDADIVAAARYLAGLAPAGDTDSGSVKD